jgi:predicted transcriptional regulator
MVASIFIRVDDDVRRRLVELGAAKWKRGSTYNDILRQVLEIKEAEPDA